MSVSRRRFLEVAACAVPGAFAGGRWIGSSSSAPAAGPSRALLDLGADCALPDSRSGFARGLGAAKVPFQSLPVERLSEWDPWLFSPLRSVVIVPGGVLRSPRVAAMLRHLADRGATVVYESGAAYADSGNFAAERDLLNRYFGVRVDIPIDLWGPDAKASFAPYVHYDWPERAMVRDFSRVIPVERAHQAFARLGGVPVAERVRFGAGEFLFLGSPLGPHVASGDREAQALLESLVRRGPLA